MAMSFSDVKQRDVFSSLQKALLNLIEQSLMTIVIGMYFVLLNQENVPLLHACTCFEPSVLCANFHQIFPETIVTCRIYCKNV
jgi:hypothetical protein